MKESEIKYDFQDLLLIEESDRDAFRVKKLYIDIADDLQAGILLGQILYWYLPNKETGRTKLRVEKEGEKWIAKQRDEWWEEIRLTARQFDRASSKLVKKGLIEKKNYKFAGKKTVHIRLLISNYVKLANEELAKRKAKLLKAQREQEREIISPEITDENNASAENSAEEQNITAAREKEGLINKKETLNDDISGNNQMVKRELPDGKTGFTRRLKGSYQMVKPLSPDGEMGLTRWLNGSHQTVKPFTKITTENTTENTTKTTNNNFKEFSCQEEDQEKLKREKEENINKNNKNNKNKSLNSSPDSSLNSSLSSDDKSKQKVQPVSGESSRKDNGETKLANSDLVAGIKAEIKEEYRRILGGTLSEFQLEELFKISREPGKIITAFKQAALNSTTERPSLNYILKILANTTKNNSGQSNCSAASSNYQSKGKKKQDKSDDIVEREMFTYAISLEDLGAILEYYKKVIGRPSEYFKDQLKRMDIAKEDCCKIIDKAAKEFDDPQDVEVVNLLQKELSQL